MTIQQIQAMITNKGDVREIINQIADYIQANPGGSGGGVASVTAGDASITVGGTATNPTVKLPYKVYTSLFSQESALVDPTVTALENTIGSVVWARDSTGNYSGTLTGAFTQDKTHFAPFGDFNGDASTYLPIWGGSGAILGYWTMYQNGEDQVAIQVKDASGVATDLFTLIGATTLMLADIKVFP